MTAHTAAPGLLAALSEALPILQSYARYIRHHVKADDLEMHPYLPHVEQCADEIGKRRVGKEC